MRLHRGLVLYGIAVLAVCANVSNAHAQSSTGESPWSIDAGFGISPSINGNVNSGVIGTLQGQTVAILPNPYGGVYGTGIDLRGGADYALNDLTELRGVFVWQSADADLVRMGDLGASALYGQYSSYMSFALDLGVRRYAPLSTKDFRVYGEATAGIGWINRIDLQLAAPQSNTIVNATDLYDRTAAFTFGVNVGILVPIAESVDFNAQLGLRHVSGLADVDQFVGTNLAALNDDSARLTFPIVIGVRFRFK